MRAGRHPLSRLLSPATYHMVQSRWEVVYTLGVIDTLTAGFNTVVRKPWLVLIPLVLDLLLLWGPKVSVAPIYEQLGTAVERMALTTSDQGLVDANVELVREQLHLLQDMEQEYNLLSLISVNRLLLPSVAGLRPIEPETDRVVSIAEPARAMVIAVLTLAVGLFIACAYLTLLAQQIRAQPSSLSQISRLVPLFWLRALAVIGLVLLFFLGLVIGGGVLVLAAQVFVLIGLPAITQGLLGLFFLASWLITIWVFFYLFFVPQALTLAEVGALMAVKQSFVVVRMSFWQALGLILLVNIITAGLGYLWGLMMSSQLGTLAAILANAFIGTGLITAVFIFFRDRLVAIHQAAQKQAQRDAQAL